MAQRETPCGAFSRGPSIPTGKLLARRRPSARPGQTGLKAKTLHAGLCTCSRCTARRRFTKTAHAGLCVLASLNDGERERGEERSVHRPPRCFAAPLPKFAPGTRCAAYKKRFALKAVRTATAPAKIFTKTGPLATWRRMQMY